MNKYKTFLVKYRYLDLLTPTVGVLSGKVKVSSRDLPPTAFDNPFSSAWMFRPFIEQDLAQQGVEFWSIGNVEVRVCDD